MNLRGVTNDPKIPLFRSLDRKTKLQDFEVIANLGIGSHGTAYKVRKKGNV